MADERPQPVEAGDEHNLPAVRAAHELAKRGGRHLTVVGAHVR